MIHNTTLTLVLAAAFTFGGTGVIQAQEPSRGMMNNVGSMADCPMMRSISEGSGAVLDTDGLALPPDQVARLETLRESGAAARTENLTELSKPSQSMMHGTEGIGGIMEMMRHCPMMRGGMNDDPEEGDAVGSPAGAKEA